MYTAALTTCLLSADVCTKFIQLHILSRYLQVFLSDNGGLPAVHKQSSYEELYTHGLYPTFNLSLADHNSNMNLRGHKGEPHEGMHVPAIP